MSINDAKCTVLPAFLASAITSFFVSDCRQLPCRYLFNFVLFFIHYCFCFMYFHCLRHWDKFVHKMVMVQRIDSFPCNMIFMTIITTFTVARLTLQTRKLWWCRDPPVFFSRTKSVPKRENFKREKSKKHQKIMTKAKKTKEEK